MHAPVESPDATVPPPSKERPRRSLLKRLVFFKPLGFSLRLNLWYAGFFVFGAFVLFSLAYLLLTRELRESDREIVLAKLFDYRAWYLQGGRDALQDHFVSESQWEQDSSFLV